MMRKGEIVSGKTFILLNFTMFLHSVEKREIHSHRKKILREFNSLNSNAVAFTKYLWAWVNRLLEFLHCARYAKCSVRPNTEYSAEYSAKTSRIFGTEYSAVSADTPITENSKKRPFLCVFCSNFGQNFSVQFFPRFYFHFDPIFDLPTLTISSKLCFLTVTYFIGN